MKRKNAFTMRPVALLAVLVAVTAVIATFVIAKYLKNDEVGNTLSPAVSENPKINETFENNVKENVYFEVFDEKVGNPTQYPVYFRVAIVITWKNEAGIIHNTLPVEGKDYELVLNLGKEDPEYGGTWILDDGYYYYDIPVKSDGRTSILIESCSPLDGANQPEGFTLSVEIIVQTVQAVGSTDDNQYKAWEDAWENFGSSSETTTPSDSGITATEPSADSNEIP